jgi:hypothetical protein
MLILNNVESMEGGTMITLTIECENNLKMERESEPKRL